jgi:hypothetical protein
MKKNETKFYFTTILLFQILVYFFKIDRDVFAFQEYFSRSNQTYTEQPLSKKVSYFGSSISVFCQFIQSCEAKNNCTDRIAIWNSILLSYNSRVHHLLQHNETHLTPKIKIIGILHRKNIFHKSSEDEVLEYRFLA